MRSRVSATFTTAAAPVPPQANRARPAEGTTENAGGPPTAAGGATCGPAIHPTSQGETSASVAATQLVTSTRYVSTKAYGPRAPRPTATGNAQERHSTP